MKRWTKIVLLIAGVVIAAIASIPLFVNANTFRPVIEKQLTTALGREVKLGDLSLSVWHGGLVAESITVGDDPNFSAAPFLTSKKLRIGVSMRMLILSHQLNLRSFEIGEPQINLIQAANGTWNVSSLGRGAAGNAAPSGAAPAAASGNSASENSGSAAPELPNLSVGLIVIENARVEITSLPAHGVPMVFEQVNLTAKEFSFGAQFPFDLSANLPSGGSISVDGHLGPINHDDVAASPADMQISVKHLNPVTAGFLNAESGISLVADMDMHAASDGQTIATSGTVQIQNLKLRKGAAAAASKPIELTYKGTSHLKGSAGQIEDASVKFGGSAVHVSGSYQPDPHDAENPLLNLKLVGQGVPIDELQPIITAADIRLPNNSVLKGGTLSMNFAISGQAKSLVITGPLELNKTKLVGFDVGSKIHGIAALGGMKTGDTTEYELLRVNVHMTNDGVQANNIEAVITGMGNLTGSGTVSAANQLDFNLTVQMDSAKGISKVGVGLLTVLNGAGGSTGNGSGVPIHIGGTPDEPYITASVGGVVGRKTKSIASIFGKKK